jgi:membrane fusion protein, multidrug efflux system
MFKPGIVVAAFIAAALAGCNKSVAPAPEARPVRTVTVQGQAQGEIVSLTGQVRAKDQVSLAFRLDGRMIERPVHVGDVLTAGQVVARLDPQNQENTLRSAQDSVSSAEAVLIEARLTFSRQQELLKAGVTPRAKFDEAQQNFRSAQAQFDSAHAQLRIAQDQLGYTVLNADAPGVVTAVGAEPGEVVRAGQSIVQVAREGGRDAVFDVPEQLIRTGPRDPLVEIALTNDPRVTATGRVREVAPQADSATRTFQVKVGITKPPEAMRLGATVTGRLKLSALPGVEVPASALTEANGHPAVWIVDPQSNTVSLRDVDVLRYDPSSVVISHGLDTGDIVVTAGVQTLHPGQKVRLPEAG